MAVVRSLALGVVLSIAVAAIPLHAQAIKGLEANGPLPALEDKMTLFGQFVGDWELDATIYNPDGSKQTGKGEWHWGWILGGRAIQDVYILRSTVPKDDSPVVAIGTTLRFLDPKTNDWRIVYAGPMSGYLYTFSVRKAGDDIVLEGKENDGSPMRWILSEIRARSFHWRAVVSPDEGRTWQLRAEMSVYRTAH